MPHSSLIPHSPHPNSPSEGAGIHQGEEKALEDALPSMVRLFCPPLPRWGCHFSLGLGSCLRWPSLSPQGGFPRPCLAGDAGESPGLGLRPEPCAPSPLFGPAGNAGDLLLQALQQSCLEDHLLEAAWGAESAPPEAPGERLCRMGVLGLAELHARGEEQAGWQSPCGEGEGGGGGGGGSEEDMQWGWSQPQLGPQSCSQPSFSSSGPELPDTEPSLPRAGELAPMHQAQVTGERSPGGGGGE